MLTRPLGASFADWLGKPHATGGGLGLGDGPVTLLALAAVLVLVAHLTRARRDVQDDRRATVPSQPSGLRDDPADHTV